MPQPHSYSMPIFISPMALSYESSLMPVLAPQLLAALRASAEKVQLPPGELVAALGRNSVQQKFITYIKYIVHPVA